MDYVTIKDQKKSLITFLFVTFVYHDARNIFQHKTINILVGFELVFF